MSDPFSNQPADPFVSSGVGGAPVVRFNAIGDSITGVVKSIVQQVDTDPTGTPKTWPDGQPMHVFIFTLDTDEGEQRLFVRGNMVTAIREASGGRSTIGQLLTVQHYALGEAKRGFSPAKLFRAKVAAAPVKAAAPAANVDEAW